MSGGLFGLSFFAPFRRSLALSGNIAAEEVDQMGRGRGGVLDAAYHEHDLAVHLRHGGAGDDAVGVLGQYQPAHVADAQAVFDKREDEVVVAAGVLHPRRNLVTAHLQSRSPPRPAAAWR